MPDYVPADQVAALPDLLRPEVTERMATLVVQGTTPGAGLTMRSQELVREYGLTRSAGATGSGTWQIISTVNAPSPPGTASSPALAAAAPERGPLRPLDDPLGVIPPPDQAWPTANRAAFERPPARTRAVLQRVRFTRADPTAMDYAVNVDGLDPPSAARFMDEHSDDVRRWLGCAGLTSCSEETTCSRSRVTPRRASTTRRRTRK